MPKNKLILGTRGSKLALTQSEIVKSNPVINSKFGKADQDDKDLAENASVIIQELTGKLEKGTNQIKSISIKTTMGPTVKVLKT